MQSARLPVWEMTCAAYRVVWAVRQELAERCWLYGVIAYVGWVCLLVDKGLGYQAWLSMVGVVMVMFAIVPFTVSLHRWVLLGEPLEQSTRLRWNNRDWLFLWTVTKFAAIYLLLEYTLLQGLSHEAGKSVETIATLHSALARCAMLQVALSLVLGRLSLAFPATAVDDERRPIRAAWRLSSGQTLRFAALCLLVGLPLDLLSYALEVIEFDFVGRNHSYVVELLGAALLMVTMFWGTALGATAASLAYRTVKSGGVAERIETRPVNELQ